MHISDTVIQRQTAANHIDIKDVASFILSRSTLSINVYNNSLKASSPDSKTTGLTISDVNQVQISEVLFSNHSANHSSGGGALRITESESIKAPTNYFRIEDSVFEGNVNLVGGAISLVNVANVSIEGT